MTEVGFSTGCFWKHRDTVSDETVEILRSLGADCIEINAGQPERLQQTKGLDPPEGFSFISMHGPAVRKGEHQTIQDIEQAVQRLGIQAVVFHPDRVEDWDMLARSKIPVSVENMDSRKESGRNVADMRAILTKYPSFRFCLDVNHVLTNDPTLQLGREFISEFSDRLSHVHISGFSEMHNHIPISKTHQDDLFSILPDVPMIIESDLLEVDYILEAREEIEYIRKNLEKQ